MPRASISCWSSAFRRVHLVGEEQHAERDQDHAGDDRDLRVVVAEELEEAGDARERERRQQERDRHPQRVEGEQHRALADVGATTRRPTAPRRASRRCTAARRPRTPGPASTGPPVPARFSSPSGRHSRLSAGTNSVAMKKTPIATMIAPEIWRSSARLSCSVWPMPVAVIPSRMNMTVNDRQKISAGIEDVRSCCGPPGCRRTTRRRSSTGSPARAAARTGETNDRKPAPNAAKTVVLGARRAAVDHSW